MKITEGLETISALLDLWEQTTDYSTAAAQLRPPYMMIIIDLARVQTELRWLKENTKHIEGEASAVRESWANLENTLGL